MDEERQLVDTLIKNAIVITMNAGRDVLDPGYLALRDGVVVAVGRGSPTPALTARLVLDAEGGIVHPGFIDGHAHTGWALTRCLVPLHYSAEESKTLCESPVSHAVRDSDEIVGTALACAEMAMNGTTCFADTGSAAARFEGIAEGVDRIGIRGMVSLFNADADERLNAASGQTDACLRRIEEGFSRFPVGQGRVWACAGVAGGEYSSDELLREAKAIASAHRGQLNIHQSSRREEVEAQRRRFGKDPVCGLADFGILDEGTTLVHVNVCTDAEAELLRDTGTCVVHCPSTSRLYGLGVPSSYGRFPELISAGARVGLGTDSTIFPNSWNLMRQAYLSTVLHRDGSSRPLIFAENALEMATLGGAACVGRSSELGSLEVGKLADLVIHYSDRPEVHPLMHVVNTLILSANSSTVRTVIVDGEVVVSEGRVVKTDLNELSTAVDDAAHALIARSGINSITDWPARRMI